MRQWRTKKYCSSFSLEGEPITKISKVILGAGAKIIPYIIYSAGLLCSLIWNSSYHFVEMEDFRCLEL